MNYAFTDRVRIALAAAREEARRLGHDYVGTEHILLGLVRDERSPVAGALARLGAPVARVRGRVEVVVAPGGRPRSLRDLPYTSRAKKVLQLAMEEARRLGDRYVGTEHLLVGLIREEKGIAARVLAELGVTQRRFLDALGGAQPPEGAESGGREDARPVWYLEVDADAQTPIYGQIIAGLEEAVALGRLDPGERLPTVRQLAEEIGVAPGTVARAYAELERRGVIETAGARGTFVAQRDSAGKARMTDLEGLLRPVAVAAFHLGASAVQLRDALERAMKGILKSVIV